MITHWRTKLGATISLAGAAFTAAVPKHPAMGIAISALGAAAGLWFATDNVQREAERNADTKPQPPNPPEPPKGGVPGTPPLGGNPDTDKPMNETKPHPLARFAGLLGPLLLAATLILGACKSPETTAYRASGLVITSVDAGMNAWGDYVRAGKATADDQTRVRAAYDKYVAAVKLEQDAITAYHTNQNVDALHAAINGLAASSADVLALIALIAPEAAAKAKGTP